MMKRRKWLISLVVLGVIMGFSVPKPKAGINGDVSLDSLAVRDTVALPPLSYSMKVGKDTLILPDSSKAWNNFFNELDSLRAGKDTAITIVQLGDSHIQAGHLSGRVMRLFQQAFGNAGRGWIAPFKLSKTNEPDDYFIKSVAKDWIAGRCIQHVRKTPIGIGGIGIKSVSPSINLDVVITPNNGAGYEFNEAILYRGEKSMPMLPAGALKDSVQTFRADTVCVPGVLADTFRISCLTDTLQLQSTRRKEGTNTLRPASSFTNLYYGLTLKNGGRGILYHSIGVNGAMYVNYTDEAYVRQLALLKPSLLIISMGTNETFGRRFNTDEFSGQIEAFLAIVKKELPNTAILLTTPPECYRRVRSGKQRTYVRNDNTERAARAIRNVAKKEEKLGDILTYHHNAPILFSSGLFFFLFIGFLMIYMSLRKHTLARIIYVTLFSLYFYYKSSGLWFGLLVFTATSDFLIAQCISHTTSVLKRKLFVTLSLCINLGMLGYFKYFNFLGELFTMAAGGEWLKMNIFLPVGISFFIFQSISYVIDVYRGRIQPLGRWIDYVFYVSFFPQLVAGPIVRARDFIPQMYKNPTVTRSEFGEGLFLILCGLFKKTVISDYISMNFVDRIFDAPLLYTGVENLLGVYGYALQIYCDFSGYSDMAIGIALLLGFRFNINFDSPYQSATITEFWRRWHISLSSWLKDYLYISLGGNRKGKIRTYMNLMITMLLGGLWHGASISFILWGALHGIALAAHKFIMGHFSSFKALGCEMKPWRRVLGVLITFHVVCFGWILFRATSMKAVGEMLSQIFTNFHPEVFMQFVSGYKGVFALMVIGYVLHFMPKRSEDVLREIVTRSPLLIQAAILAIAIFIVVQFKSAGVQPFIYFQF